MIHVHHRSDSEIIIPARRRSYIRKQRSRDRSRVVTEHVVTERTAVYLPSDVLDKGHPSFHCSHIHHSMTMSGAVHGRSRSSDLYRLHSRQVCLKRNLLP